jgi:hypothetical protein
MSGASNLTPAAANEVNEPSCHASLDTENNPAGGIFPVSSYYGVLADLALWFNTERPRDAR